MILSTTPQIEGYNIREYKGVVTGETIIGANFMKDIFAGIRDIVGGRSASYEKVLRKAKDTAMQEMMEREQLHAHGRHQRHRRGHLNYELRVFNESIRIF